MSETCNTRLTLLILRVASQPQLHDVHPKNIYYICIFVYAYLYIRSFQHSIGKVNHSCQTHFSDIYLLGYVYFSITNHVRLLFKHTLLDTNVPLFYGY